MQHIIAIYDWRDCRECVHYVASDKRCRHTDADIDAHANTDCGEGVVYCGLAQTNYAERKPERPRHD